VSPSAFLTVTEVETSISVRFEDLGLIEPLTRAVAAEGYTQPTPIQQKAIPHVLAGKDLLGLAQTGTGKTAAFALPILQRLHAMGYRPHGDRPIRVLVLTPTRELAAQIGDSFARYGLHLGYRHTVIFGGVGQTPQERALRAGIDVLVATPGRLLDLCQQKVVHLGHLDIFVLDEADRMLDMGFIHDVRKVIALLPKKRQTLFFSATMPPEAQKLADVLLHAPETVAVTPVSSTAERIEQSVHFVDKAGKRQLLVDVLADQAMARVLVFSRTKHGANRIAEYLHKAGIRAEAIHGNKSQNARERALAGFKDGSNRVLVATDIAARGIDIDDVTHVVNFDLPEVPETYVHRIGRTARAGRSGAAISFCDQEERVLLRDIERLTRRSIPVAAPVPRAAPNRAVQAALASVPDDLDRDRERVRPGGREHGGRDGGGRDGGRRDGGRQGQPQRAGGGGRGAGGGGGRGPGGRDARGAGGGREAPRSAEVPRATTPRVEHPRGHVAERKASAFDPWAGAWTDDLERGQAAARGGGGGAAGGAGGGGGGGGGGGRRRRRRGGRGGGGGGGRPTPS
jgi:ATP-dependent RNA helicase RhlE